MREEKYRQSRRERPAGVHPRLVLAAACEAEEGVAAGLRSPALRAGQRRRR